MVFAIYRASNGAFWDEDDPGEFAPQPCAKAQLVDTPPFVRPLYGNPKIWVVRLDDMDDLLELQREVKSPLIMRGDNSYIYEGIQTIQIYDGYIE